MTLGLGRKKMSLQHFSMSNSQAALRKYWGRGKTTLKPNQEVLVGRERTLGTCHKDKCYTDLNPMKQV